MASQLRRGDRLIRRWPRAHYLPGGEGAGRGEGAFVRSRVTRVTWLSHSALQEVGHERPDEVGVMWLEAVVIRMAEAVVGVGEEVPLDGLAVGDEALPERALDGGRRDVVLAAAEHERCAPECLRELECVSGAVPGLGFVAHGGIVEDDRTHVGMVGR